MGQGFASFRGDRCGQESELWLLAGEAGFAQPSFFGDDFGQESLLLDFGVVGFGHESCVAEEGFCHSFFGDNGFEVGQESSFCDPLEAQRSFPSDESRELVGQPPPLLLLSFFGDFLLQLKPPPSADSLVRSANSAMSAAKSSLLSSYALFSG